MKKKESKLQKTLKKLKKQKKKNKRKMKDHLWLILEHANGMEGQ